MALSPYPGTNPDPAYTGLTPTAGYGVWPVPMEADGGDGRSAANQMTICETLVDRSNFIAWRTPNWIDGGSQLIGGIVTFSKLGSGTVGVQWAVPVSVIAANGSLTMNNRPLYIAQGATLYVGGDSGIGIGHLLCDATGDGAGSNVIVSGGAPLKVTGFGSSFQLKVTATMTADAGTTATFNGSVSLAGDNTIGGTVLRTGREQPKGTGATTSKRFRTLTTSGASTPIHVNLWEADVWELPSPLPAPQNYLLQDSGLDVDGVLHIATESTIQQTGAAAQAFDASFLNFNNSIGWATLLANASASSTHFGSLTFTHSAASGTPILSGAFDPLFIHSIGADSLVNVS